MAIQLVKYGVGYQPVCMRVLDKDVYLKDELRGGLHEGLKEAEEGGIGVLVHHQRVITDTGLELMQRLKNRYLK